MDGDEFAIKANNGPETPGLPVQALGRLHDQQIYPQAESNRRSGLERAVS
jgi:hypothetical protein